MEYDYRFEYSFPDAMEGAAEGALVGAAGVITGIVLIVYLLALAFSVASYVLNAVGMYRIAKRRGIHHAWLAWIPVGCNWLLGSISDHYQYVAKQKITGRRKVLLILSLILLVLSCVFGAAAPTVVWAIEGAADEMVSSAIAIAMMAISYLGMVSVSIAITVFCYIAYYDLFQSSKPNNAVLFLVLGILINVTLPFFVFACSGSDKGMPAKRTQQPPVQLTYEQPGEDEVPVVEAEVVEDSEM